MSIERKPLTDIVTKLLGFAAIAALLYGISFVYFIRSRSRVGLRGPVGHAVTTGYLAVPDTPINRALAVLYRPLLTHFGKTTDAIEWETR
jgi:hypothetical protein